MSIFGGGPTASTRDGEDLGYAHREYNPETGEEEIVYDPDPLIDIAEPVTGVAEDFANIPGDVYDAVTDPWRADTSAIDEQGRINEEFYNRMMLDLGYGGPLEGTLDPATFGPAAQLDLGPQGEFRGRQMTLADQLAALGRGEGESIADLQMRAAMERIGQEQRAMAAMAPGGAQRGASLRAAMRGTAQSQQVGARDAAIARAMESLEARSQLGGLLGKGRGQDITLTTEQARLEQERRRENLRSVLGHRETAARERGDIRGTAAGARGTSATLAANKARIQAGAKAAQRDIILAPVKAYADYKTAGAAGGG